MVDATGPYALLGVAPTASPVELREAYKQKAIRLHPDKGGDVNEFKKVRDAYNLLSNPQTRKLFDDTGRRKMTPEEELRAAIQESKRQSLVSRPSLAPSSRMSIASDSESRGRVSIASDNVSICGGRDSMASLATSEAAPTLLDPPAKSKSGVSMASLATSEAAPTLLHPPAKSKPGVPPAPSMPSAPSVPSESKRSSSAKAVKVKLPPALQAAVEGRSLETLDVPAELLQPVHHVVVTKERHAKQDRTKSLKVISQDPAIEDGMLKEGEVLVQMRAMPISWADLNLQHSHREGEIYGFQGIGQVRFLGPRVGHLDVGDWVVLLQPVDEDGDVDDHAPQIGTGRTLIVCPSKQCARLASSADNILSIGQMAIAKSIGTAYRLVEKYAMKLNPGETVIVNAANGVVGQVMVQLMAVLRFNVIAVVREVEGMEPMMRRLETMGAVKALLDEDNLRLRIEETVKSLPHLALDGVGGEATARLAGTLARNGDIICYGKAGGSLKQVLPSGWGKKFKGAARQFSFDAWLQRDIESNSKRFNDMLQETAKMLRSNCMWLQINEYQVTTDFNKALKDARTPGRSHAVILHFPTLQSMDPRILAGPDMTQTARFAELACTRSGAASRRPIKKHWDLAFFEWEETHEVQQEKRAVSEAEILQVHGPLRVETDEKTQIQRYLDDPLATTVVAELGASVGQADAVIFWLPGINEMPNDNLPWLTQLCKDHPNLRVLLLKPKVGTKWFDTSDREGVKMGLNFVVVDDEQNIDGDPANSAGDIAFSSLETEEIRALRQVEGAAISLTRRALLEEEAILKALDASGTIKPRWASREEVPFYFGGSGQGGSVALFSALCVMPKAIRGVSFIQSGIPVAAMLGKRLQARPWIKHYTNMHGLYDKADEQIPTAFPEAVYRMFKLLDCSISMDWLDSDVDDRRQANEHGDFERSVTDKASEKIVEALQFDIIPNHAQAAWGGS